ncbi:MAG: bacterioferritin [Vicinamibacterales bacterium]
MRGNDTVIAHLNEALREELSAINQYFLHAEMCISWGYTKLGKFIKKQSIDEMRHAEKVIERLLFLDAVPKMDYLPLNVGQSVREQLDADLKLELNAVSMYNKAVRASREAGDDISADLFKTLLADEERHVDWLESQMHQIKEIGYEIYLSNQVGEAAE